MNSLFRTSAKFIQRFDAFKSPVNLRYNLDPDYATSAGGCFTVCLLVLLCGLFFNSWVQFLKKQQISSSTQKINEFDPTYESLNPNDFTFAVGILGFNLSNQTPKKFFQFQLTKHIINNGIRNQTKVILQQCTVEHWENYGPQFVQIFNKNKLSGFLCPPKNYSMQLSGKFTSNIFQFIRLFVNPCINEQNCANKTDIQEFIKKQNYFSFNFYYTNTLLNPDKKQPIQKFFQDKQYVTFSDKMAILTNNYISSYTMTTDESIFPWSSQQVKKGYLIERSQKQILNYVYSQGQPYVKFYIRKSNTGYQIERKFLKLDEILSYIGGFFGLIAVFFGLIMTYYGQCQLELEMCQKIFDYNKERKAKQEEVIDNNNQIQPPQQKQQKIQKLIQPSEFGFFDFVCHLIYEFLSLFCTFKWQRMQAYSQSLQQMRYKLDVGQIIQKLSFYDKAFTSLFDQNQLKLLYLQQKINFEQVRNQRKLLNLRNDINYQVVESLITKIVKQNQNQLKQTQLTSINKRKSAKKSILKSFIGNPFDFLQDLNINKYVNNNRQIPPQIIQSIVKLQEHIGRGDRISMRIYQGLDQKLLRSYTRHKNLSNIYRKQTQLPNYIIKSIPQNPSKFKKSSKLQLFSGEENSSSIESNSCRSNSSLIINQLANKPYSSLNFYDIRIKMSKLKTQNNNFSQLNEGKDSEFAQN